MANQVWLWEYCLTKKFIERGKHEGQNFRYIRDGSQGWKL